jgi:hypothetical protein
MWLKLKLINIQNRRQSFLTVPMVPAPSGHSYWKLNDSFSRAEDISTAFSRDKEVMAIFYTEIK